MQNLRRIVKALQEYSSSVEKQFGLTGPQLWALWELNRRGPMSLKGLAERMHLDPSTVTGVVERLHRKGLVSREADAEDRRRVVLGLTEEGRKTVRTAPHPAQGQLLHALSVMDADQVEQLNKTLQLLASVMEADKLEVRFFFSEE
ncbi:MAG: MarR family transcriptional regulator [Holophagaceae bacterium]